MISPLGDVIIIRRSAPQEVSDGGVLLAWDPDFKEDIGVVAFVGKGKLHGCKNCRTEHRRKPEVNVGDKVIFSTNGHQIITVGMEELVVLREQSIIGVIE